MSAFTYLVTTPSTANATTYATGSVSPAVGDLIVVAVNASGTVLATPVVTGTNGLNLTYTKITSTTSTTTSDTIYLYVSTSLVTSTTAGVITFDCTGDAATGAVVAVYSLSGMTKMGANSVVQSKVVATTAAGTPGPVFTSAPAARNPLFGMIGNGTSPAGMTPPTGWTENATAIALGTGGDTGYSTPTTGLETTYLNSGATSATVTWGGASASAYGAIIAEFDSPPQVNVSENLTAFDYTITSSSVADSYNESNQNTFQYLGNSNITGDGQSITGDGNYLSSAKFYLLKTGSPTGSARAKVYAHSGVFGTSSVPTGSALAISETLDVSTTTGSFALYELIFLGANQIKLTNATNYVLTIEYLGNGNNANDSINYIRVGNDTTSPTHVGNFVNNISGTWGALSSVDASFYLYTSTTQTPTSIVTISGGVASPTVNVSDSTTITENIQMLLESNINKTDNLTLTESVDVTRDGARDVNVSDSTSLTESIGRLLESNINKSESVTITENVAKLIEITVNKSDTVTLTENVVGLLESYVNKSDNITITEAITKLIPELYATVSDSITISENRALDIPIEVNKSESITVTESKTVDLVVTANVNDTITITENKAADVGVTVNKSESATITENVAVAIVTDAPASYDINVSDSITITESVTKLLESYVNKTDTVTVTESVSSLITELFLSVNDSTTLTESINRLLESYVNKSDTATITEAVTGLLTSSINVNDTATITENLKELLESFVNKSDTATLTETVTVYEPAYNLSVSDSVTVTENLKLLLESNVNKSDTVTITESVTLLESISLSVSDNLTVTEVVTDLLTSFVNKSDTITITEATTVNIVSANTPQIVTSETVTVSENVSLLIPTLRITVTDNVTITESSTVTIQSLATSQHNLLLMGIG